MTPGGAGRELLSGGAAFAVDVRALGKELRRLWEESGDPGGPRLTRACTRNLVVLADDDETAQLATDAIAAVAHRHPTRAFVVTAAAKGADPLTLEAHLSAHCILRGGGRHVCCELIALSVGSDARRRAAGAIVPLLVPDLPVFVWRPGALVWDDELLARLLDVADRFVIDTAACTDAAAVLADLAGRKRDDRWSPGDFTWSRLAPWREAVAALFDAPDTAHLPARIERVVVRYGAGGNRACAALLGAWATDRIEVTRERAAAGLAARVAAGDGAGDPGAVELVLTAVTDVPPGAIAGIDLTSSVPKAVCTIAAVAGDSALTARVDLPESCALPSRHPGDALSLERLLADQLDERRPDAVYERALARAATLLGGLPPD